MPRTLVELREPLAQLAHQIALAEIVRLCEDPAGKHPLRAPRAGWNTLDVLGGQLRVVYKASASRRVGLLEVLCIGPRSQSEVYDMALAAVRSGQLEDHEQTQLFEALGLLDLVAEEVGLDGWDYRPKPAPAGTRRAALAAGVIDQETADLLAKDELEAAMASGWGPHGPDPQRGLVAALHRARGSADFAARQALEARGDDRWDTDMIRARSNCIRRADHPGPHRAQ